MATVVIMPKQGQSVESCILTEMKKKKGDTVAVGDILFAYETPDVRGDIFPIVPVSHPGNNQSPDNLSSSLLSTLSIFLYFRMI